MRFSITITLACLLPAIASAQSSTGSKPVSFLESCRPDPGAPRVTLAGKVSDPSGAPLVGASVALRCGNFRQDARTTGDGTYRVTVPAGSYLVEVNAPGFDITAETAQLTKPEQRDFTLMATGGANRLLRPPLLLLGDPQPPVRVI